MDERFLLGMFQGVAGDERWEKFLVRSLNTTKLN